MPMHQNPLFLKIHIFVMSLTYLWFKRLPLQENQPNVTESIWLCSHLSHWFSHKSILKGSSYGVVIKVVIFLRTSEEMAMGMGPMCLCAVSRVILEALIWPMHLGYVCLRVGIELVTVTRCSHQLLILTNCSHMFWMNFKSSNSRIHFVERK